MSNIVIIITSNTFLHILAQLEEVKHFNQFQVSDSDSNNLGQVMKVRMSGYLVLLSVDTKSGNKIATPSWPDPFAPTQSKSQFKQLKALLPYMYIHT